MKFERTGSVQHSSHTKALSQVHCRHLYSILKNSIKEERDKLLQKQKFMHSPIYTEKAKLESIMDNNSNLKRISTPDIQKSDMPRRHKKTLDSKGSQIYKEDTDNTRSKSTIPTMQKLYKSNKDQNPQHQQRKHKKSEDKNLQNSKNAKIMRTYEHRKDSTVSHSAYRTEYIIKRKHNQDSSEDLSLPHSPFKSTNPHSNINPNLNKLHQSPPFHNPNTINNSTNNTNQSNNSMKSVITNKQKYNKLMGLSKEAVYSVNQNLNHAAIVNPADTFDHYSNQKYQNQNYNNLEDRIEEARIKREKIIKKTLRVPMMGPKVDQWGLMTLFDEARFLREEEGKKARYRQQQKELMQFIKEQIKLKNQNNSFIDRFQKEKEREVFFNSIFEDFSMRKKGSRKRRKK